MIATSLIIIYSSTRPTVLDTTPRSATALGTVLAEQVVQLLAGRGQLVIWLADTGETDLAPRDALLTALRRGIASHPALTIAGTETVTFDPPETFDDGLPTTTFLRLLRQFPNADAVLCLAGAPVLESSDWEHLPHPRPKLLVVSNRPDVLLPLFEKNLVQIAIVPHWEPLTTTSQPTTDRARFDQQYLIVTPATAESVLRPIDRPR